MDQRRSRSSKRRTVIPVKPLDLVDVDQASHPPLEPRGAGELLPNVVAVQPSPEVAVGDAPAPVEEVEVVEVTGGELHRHILLKSIVQLISHSTPSSENACSIRERP